MAASDWPPAVGGRRAQVDQAEGGRRRDASPTAVGSPAAAAAAVSRCGALTRPRVGRPAGGPRRERRRWGGAAARAGGGGRRSRWWTRGSGRVGARAVAAGSGGGAAGAGEGGGGWAVSGSVRGLQTVPRGIRRARSWAPGAWPGCRPSADGRRWRRVLRDKRHRPTSATSGVTNSRPVSPAARRARTC